MDIAADVHDRGAPESQQLIEEVLVAAFARGVDDHSGFGRRKV